MKPSKKRARTYLMEKQLKNIEELERKLSFKRLFLLRLITKQVPIKIVDHRGEEWYIDARDEELSEHVYDFIKK